jgi:hypothetical protein
MLGKPTVATVPPNFTARLAATGNAANRPSPLSNARSLAAATFRNLAETVLGWRNLTTKNGKKHLQSGTQEQKISVSEPDGKAIPCQL